VTDFFENQERARRNTVRLVVLFTLAVGAIVGMLYAVAVLVLGYQGHDPRTGVVIWSQPWWDPELLGQVAVAAGLIVGGGSLYKIAQLRGGGRVVAEHLGGRLVRGDAADALERRLLHVVEEMAIASGTATPPVYLLDQEQGINAFAAGFSPDDAVIGVTRGAVEQLSRDELQGVIAHEFSHILNGDMRLNVRLIGVVHGILIIGIIGYFLLRSSVWSGGSRRSDGRGNGAAAMVALGLALMAIGFLGTFFGNLIKASVSRQREFLADAAAVQFTRDPNGIAGALKKIGGFARGSRVDHPNAPEASHMFFSRGIVSGLNALFSTHPPLAQRIRRLDPAFDGGTAAVPVSAARQGSARVAGFGGAAIDRIGGPGPDHLRYAAELIAGLPAAVACAAREPYGGRALLYALLVNREPSARQKQLEHLTRHADPAVSEETRRLLPQVTELAAAVRLPLVDLSIPALRQLSPPQYAVFKANVAALIAADRQIDLFEWTLQRILLRHLAPGFEKVRVPRARYASLNRVAAPCRVVLSALAQAGGRSTPEAARAFACGSRALADLSLEPLPSQRCGLAQLDEALSVLNELVPLEKQRLLRACAIAVSADRSVTVEEGELLRAVADALGCPMPPLLPGQTLV